MKQAPRSLICLATLLTIACSTAPAPVASPVQPVTVFLLRHAEKVDASHDPQLSAAGEERARLLADMLFNAGVTHLYATEFQRTRNTLAPLGERLGLEVAEVPAGSPERQVALLRELPAGAVAVVAGHSNTIPDLVASLGGTVDPLFDGQLGDAEYHRLFVVVLQGGQHLETLELGFGALPTG